MIRLFVPLPLGADILLPLDDVQSHYLLHVMRTKEGEAVLAFNGRNGEWETTLQQQKKNVVQLRCIRQMRAQETLRTVRLLFAPIKRGHGDYTVEKATELGATRLSPIITARTIITRVPLARYESIAREAAEQCERLAVPVFDEPQKLVEVLAAWDKAMPLLYCAENGEAEPMLKALTRFPAPIPLAVLVGPEGGFTPEEATLLRGQNFVHPVSLGPHILRADTAAIAALSLIKGAEGS